MNYPVPLLNLLNTNPNRFRAESVIDWGVLTQSIRGEGVYLNNKAQQSVREKIGRHVADRVTITTADSYAEGKMYRGEVYALSYFQMKELLYSAYSEGISAAKELKWQPESLKTTKD